MKIREGLWRHRQRVDQHGCVVMDQNQTIVASVILPTGWGAGQWGGSAGKSVGGGGNFPRSGGACGGHRYGRDSFGDDSGSRRFPATPKEPISWILPSAPSSTSEGRTARHPSG
jgi:hypothetical protein